MKVSYNWLQSFFEKKLPEPEKTADLIIRHSFEVESVKKQGQDWVFDVSIMPNRAHDCASHLGIARDLAAILNYKLKTTDHNKKIKADKGKADEFLKVEIRDTKLCSRYTAMAVSGVKVGPAPDWMVKRLEACGLNSINSVVDIANYVMLETGQPLHAFDADKIADQGGKKTLIVRRAQKGEKITTLDDQNFDLDEEVLVIADSNRPLCIAGIKGGKGPEVDKKTRTVVLEAANFNPLSIRGTARKLKLETDASWRFEREIDANLTESAIKMAACLIQDICGGKVMSGMVDVYPKKEQPKTINLNLEKVKKLLGMTVPASQIKSILLRLGFKLSPLSAGFKVTIPTFRKDISILEDLVEEIARIYGLEKIPNQMPQAPLSLPAENDELVYRNKVKDIMSSLGFCESYNRSLVGAKYVAHNREEEIVELANPLSAEQQYLRTSLTYGLLKDLAQNRKYFKEIRLFELSRAFRFGLDRKEIIERKKLGAVVSLGDADGNKNEFYNLKGAIDSLLNKLGISDQWYDDHLEDDETVPGFCHDLRKAEVKVGDDCLGWIGEIKREVLNEVGIESRAAAFEIDFEKLVELATEEVIYAPPSKYPSVVRDIALLVERQTKVDEVLNAINNVDNRLIQDVDLFDLYEDEGFEGKKSLAFHIIYQAGDRTLTDKEVNQIQEKVVDALEKEGWEVRK